MSPRSQGRPGLVDPYGQQAAYPQYVDENGQHLPPNAAPEGLARAPIHDPRYLYQAPVADQPQYNYQPYPTHQYDPTTSRQVPRPLVPIPSDYNYPPQAPYPPPYVVPSAPVPAYSSTPPTWNQQYTTMQNPQPPQPQMPPYAAPPDIPYDNHRFDPVVEQLDPRRPQGSFSAASTSSADKGKGRESNSVYGSPRPQQRTEQPDIDFSKVCCCCVITLRKTLTQPDTQLVESYKIVMDNLHGTDQDDPHVLDQMLHAALEGLRALDANAADQVMRRKDSMGPGQELEEGLLEDDGFDESAAAKRRVSAASLFYCHPIDVSSGWTRSQKSPKSV